MWRVSKASGRPAPTLSDDDVIDYLIAEAVTAKIAKEDRDAQDKAEREAWKAKHHTLRERFGSGGGMTAFDLD